MFGFSLQKLLVLAAIVLAVWYGFKWIGRLQEQRDAEAGVRRRKFPWPGSSRRGAQEPAKNSVEDMVECPVCHTYVAAGGKAKCGRADCPY